jgi:N-acetylglucosaminyldiphosphoundecaprenol N-acetyl-beta-D-mannosaminyltransferase
MQRAGLEWLHRLASEPRRLWKRYLFGNAHFLWLLLRSRRQETGDGRQE